MKLIQSISRHRTVVLFTLAVGLGALAAFGARGYISEQLAIERERLVPRQATVQVVVAKRDLPRGESVSADTMAVREVPEQYLPASVITPARFDGYVGARITAPMRAGEPLLPAVLEGADPATFSAKVRSGIRAITIAVDEVNSLSGMLQPGDRIDLLLSVRLPSGATTPLPQEVTRPLMQDLRVLATGRQVRPGGDERNTRAYTAITVEVSPAQAQQLVVAQRSGKLTATLRNPSDRAAIDQRSLDVYGLLDIKPAPAMPSAQPAGARTFEIIVGGQGALKAQDRPAAAGTPVPHPASVPMASVHGIPGAADPSAQLPIRREAGAGRQSQSSQVTGPDAAGSKESPPDPQTPAGSWLWRSTAHPNAAQPSHER